MTRFKVRDRSGAIISILLSMCLAAASVALPRQAPKTAKQEQLQSALAYIKQSWHTLARSNAQIAEASVDPKLEPAADGRWPVYISRKEDLKQVERMLRSSGAQSLDKIALRVLPADASQVRQHGLLYLPYPYVVPGGRFNEMYGWDSYFIQVGLLRDGETELAKAMVDNFLYQIEHYGKILNANRTYYLTRSQPPFLTQMILGVYRKTRDRKWLESTVPAIEKYYAFWTTEPHLTKQTGLSRYYDLGTGPAPEVVSDEKDEKGRTHYDRVKQYYRENEVKDYDLGQYYDRETGELTFLFYVGDRSMRESGFDPSNRYGPFSIDIINYNPVCLNTLLYLMETETAEILTTLGRKGEARKWTDLARSRQQRINRLMWDASDGLYYDYNFTRKTVRKYPFVTTFYPLWAGIASRQQAARVVRNLPLFEKPGGLQTSTNESGSQWDAPYGWAPMQMIAIKGLRRYGYNEEADRLAVNFLSMVLKEFIEHNVIVEKYDVVRRESQIGAGLKFGYKSNEIGFGWTNAAFIELYSELSEAKKRDVLKLGGLPVPAARPPR
ncbi:MAG TPA: trehalase family glycosidase [Blastocatellia bacterium]|nr:trehalase family glycosidase [Blastocatellia bacterium]